MGYQHYSTTIDTYTHVTAAKYKEEIEKFGMAMDEDEHREDGLEDKIDESEAEEQGVMIMYVGRINAKYGHKSTKFGQLVVRI